MFKKQNIPLFSEHGVLRVLFLMTGMRHCS